jgi:hypothetical protein
MVLYDFAYERSSMSIDRQKKALKTLFDEILRDIEFHEGLIDSILQEAVECESNDMFGTEGLDV